MCIPYSGKLEAANFRELQIFREIIFTGDVHVNVTPNGLIIIQTFLRAKFSRLEVDSRKLQKKLAYISSYSPAGGAGETVDHI